MNFRHHHQHSYGNNLRFMFRLLSPSQNNPRMSGHSHHHNIGKSSNNSKNLHRLIL